MHLTLSFIFAVTCKKCRLQGCSEEGIEGALDLTTSTTTSTRFDRVRGNYRSRFRFHSNVAFITVNQQREKKFHKLNLQQTKIAYKTCK